MGEAGADPATVMKALGHSNISVTMKYRHVFHTEIMEAVNRLPNIVSRLQEGETEMQISKTVPGHNRPTPLTRRKK
jgi:Phage integrase family